MIKIGKHKYLLCMMAAIVLLTFLYMASGVEGYAAALGQTTENICTERTSAGVQKAADREISDAMLLLGMPGRADACPDSITAVRTALDEVTAREQQTLRILIGRFLAEMLVLVWLVHLICGILMRRYGCRMIDLWENIYYIHLVDGKKDAPFLECYIRSKCN